MSEELSFSERQELEELRKFRADYRAIFRAMKAVIAATKSLHESLDIVAEAWRREEYPGRLMEYMDQLADGDFDGGTDAIN